MVQSRYHISACQAKGQISDVLQKTLSDVLDVLN